MQSAGLIFLVMGVLVLMVMGAALLLSQDAQTPGEPLDVSVSQEDNIKGDLDEASVVLVEYSDFQCPACRSYYPIVKQLTDEFEGDMAFVYRYFPLVSNFDNAETSARAAEAAGMQDSFWEMHDKLFEGQDDWSGSDDAPEIFAGYAEELELDMEQFLADYESDEVASKVEEQRRGGLSSGVNSTPTFFLNGERIQNPQNYEQFRQVITEALEGEA